MATEPVNAPVPLLRVLEEEYEGLHGALPPTHAALNPHNRLAALYTRIHQLPQKRTALCLSGGGIRSATFALGVVQALAHLSLLTRFDYLSTVSGGGYIGSWLTAWIHRHPKGASGVMQDLRTVSFNDQDREPRPIKWLRQYSNYLSPRLGLLSADTWTLFGSYLRNLTLNWLILVPLIAAVLVAPRMLTSLVRGTTGDLGLGPSGPGWSFNLGLLCGLVALTYLHVYRPSLGSLRSHGIWRQLERQQWFLIAGLTPLIVAAFLLTNAWAWYRNAGGLLDHLSFGSLSSRGTFVFGGALIHAAGWLVSALLLHRWRAISGRLLTELLVILWSGAVGGLLLWSVLAETPLNIPVADYAEWYATFAVPAFLSMFLLTATLFVGVASRYTDDHDREWWGRAGAWTLIAMLTWSAGGALVIFGPGLLSYTPALMTSVGGVSGVISLVVGFSSRTAATGKTKPDLVDLILDRAVRLAAPLFIACLLVLVTLGTSWLLHLIAGLYEPGILDTQTIGLGMPSDTWGHALILHNSPLLLLFELTLSLVVLAGVMSIVININKFSLHSVYRNRLIRAYLGATRLPEYGVERRPNLFTGFDLSDNLQLHELVDTTGRIKKPFHVLNMAINLVRGSNLAWQQRKAQSFTASPFSCGSWNLGYRRAKEYGANGRLHRAMTLGTAMAISGAAASPNMGYHSAPAVTFLLAFFNVRLGWWLGNPGPAGRHTFDQSCPRIAVRPLFAETFGLTDANNPYVYLSDGGHFENLGLYEMVLRRCHCIVVSDASCDTARSFVDLGNAIRKIRIDLGIDIDIPTELLQVQPDNRLSRAHYALGIIRYDQVDREASPGLLIYLKPSLTGNEPADVRQYASCHDEFPHEPTADQFFDESQFESYRALGFHIAEKVFSQPLSKGTGQAEALFEAFRSGQTG
ncbi:MAG TPA: patatin-like phospholipase family protein [Nitrospira sp.]|nr:patatin-like phospholipase family protein [Nitrospira sp.]